MEKYTPKKEWLAYCVGALGQGMVYAIMSSYISDFYMNVLKLTPLFVLLLMLFARIWDAINDPIMGYIMDRAHPKRGKMRPYLLYTPIPIAILTVLLFYAPNLSGVSLMVYASVTYVLWGMIYTSSDVPFWSLPNAMTPNPAERGDIISKGRTANGVGSAVPMAFFMVLGFILPKFNLSGTELEKTKYMVIALFCAIVGNILFASVYFKTKERVHIPDPPKRKKGEKTALGRIFSCKPLMLTALMGVLSSARYMYQAGAVHVARYSFYIGKDLTGLSLAEKEAALQSNVSLVSTVFQVASALGMFGAMLLMPLLFRKFNYKQIIIFTSLLGAAASMIVWFLGYERFWLCVPFFVISCIPLGAINVCSFAMIGDCLDYMEWKTGARLTGLGSAIQSFVTKFGNAISTSFIIVMYMIVNLNVADINASVTANPLEMTEAVRTGMFSLISIIPAVSLLLCTVPLFFYDLVGEKKDRITKELAEQRAARGVVIEN
ncbi:MAG TPA: MFS transporter [Candidatus Fimenecus excrementavium]|nr:MFS transporter [Candidatus Fimenecus excrementavium]